MKKKINKNILITGAGSLIGQGLIKTIKSYSLKSKIVGADYIKNSVGLYWCEKTYLLPDILDKKISEKKWLKSILKIISKEKIDILIPCADFEIILFAKFRKYIEERYNIIILVSDFSLVDKCNDKLKTVNLLKKLNLDYPKSSIPNKKFYESKKKFPLIVKPRKGSTSKNVFIVKNNLELKHAIKKCKLPIIQELLEGDEYTCGTIFLGSKVISSISLRRYLKNGNTSIAFSEKNSLVNNYVKKVTKILKPFGPMNFQLKLTINGPIIFEINPRFSGTTPIREKFGLNEYQAILETIYSNKNYNYNIKKGIVFRFLDDFFLKSGVIKKIKKI